MGEIEFVYVVLMLMSIIFAIVIFTGKRFIFKYNYSHTLLFIMIISGPLNLALYNQEQDYMYLMFIILIFIPIYILVAITRKDTYILENVKVSNLIEIITKYLEDENIKYEVKEKKIFLPEHNKTIDIKGNWELILNLKEIAKLSFSKDMLEYIKKEIKSIKQQSFPFNGIVYLIYAGALYWLIKWII